MAEERVKCSICGVTPAVQVFETYWLCGDCVFEKLEDKMEIEKALEKRLRREYIDEDHRLGGIGITYGEFRKKALADEN